MTVKREFARRVLTEKPRFFNDLSRGKKRRLRHRFTRALEVLAHHAISDGIPRKIRHTNSGQAPRLSNYIAEDIPAHCVKARNIQRLTDNSPGSCQFFLV